MFRAYTRRMSNAVKAEVPRYPFHWAGDASIPSSALIPVSIFTEQEGFHVFHAHIRPSRDAFPRPFVAHSPGVPSPADRCG